MKIIDTVKSFIQSIDKKQIKELFKNKKRKNIILSVSSVILLLIILSIFRQGAATPTIEWAMADQGAFTVDLIETGDIEAVSQILVNAPMIMGGALQVIELIPEGSVVKEGDFLLQFDTGNLVQQKEQREDQLASLVADLERMKAQQALQIYNLETQLKMSQYSYDQALLTLEMRKYESAVRQEEANIQLKQAEISLKTIQTQLESQKIINKNAIANQEWSIQQARDRVQTYIDYIDMCRLEAPADGMVAYEQFRGERVKEGFEPFPGFPLISIIPDSNKMQVKVFINEVDRLKIKRGQEAEITLDAYPDIHFHGKVISTSSLASIVTGQERLKGFVVYVDIRESDNRLKPGLTAKVRIILDRLEDVVTIPVNTVFEVNGEPVVFQKGKEKPLSVVLGPRNDGYVVVESGVKPGMQLSWVNLSTEGGLLGKADEQKRVDEIAHTLQQSFTVFQERGILHDYQGEMEEKSSSGPAVDLDNLPPAIRQRLQREASEN